MHIVDSVVVEAADVAYFAQIIAVNFYFLAKVKIVDRFYAWRYMVSG